MRIQRNLGSAAVNVFDTKIEMLPPHESVSRSVAAKYIKMTFRIQQAENKPRLSRRILAAAAEKFPAKSKISQNLS